MRIAGVILAGGLGSRMGGRDKAMLTLAGEPLHARAARRLAPQVTSLALNANGDGNRFGDPGLPVIRDDGEVGGGPLAGVLAGLRWAAVYDPVCAAIVTVPVDTPFFPDDLAEKLVAAAPRGDTIAVAASRGRLHPTVALWPVPVADDLAAHLAGGGSRRMTDFIEAARHVTVAFPLDQGEDPFFNLNTPADLAAAHDRIGN